MQCNLIYAFINCEPINGQELEKGISSHYLKNFHTYVSIHRTKACELPTWQHELIIVRHIKRNNFLLNWTILHLTLQYTVLIELGKFCRKILSKGKPADGHVQLWKDEQSTSHGPIHSILELHQLIDSLWVCESTSTSLQHKELSCSSYSYAFLVF